MDEIRQALYALTGKGTEKAIRRLADAFEDITLSYETFPDEGVDLTIEILSVKELFTKPGIDAFLLKFATDIYRLSNDQKRRLLDTICRHYSDYSDTDLCWVLGDMIARYFDQATAFRTFECLFDSAGVAGKEGVVLGLDVLARQSKRDPGVMEKIDAILNSHKHGSPCRAG